jgi:predicted lipoprotein with Yx(FWY)xxD motif
MSNHRATRTTRLLAAAAALTFVLSACGDDDDAGSDSSNTTRTTEVAEVAVQSRAIDGLGNVLTDNAGLTLYFFDNDKPVKPKSTCNGQCAMRWPPLLTSDGEGVGDGIDAAMLGEVTRDDGAEQYTFNGLPLYRYVDDKAPGDASGQGVGGVWHVAGADGNAIVDATTTSTTAAAAARSATTTARTRTQSTAAPATSPPATSPPATSPPATSPPTTSPYYYP